MIRQNCSFLNLGQKKPGKQWSNITRRLKKHKFKLQNFRSQKDWFIFATFDPARFGLIYYRTLVWIMYRQLVQSDKKIFHKIIKRQVGKPISILSKNSRIDLDYLIAFSEVKFILKHIKQFNCIIEIGGGYGRTCHTLLSLKKNIKHYFIIDLPFMLNIAKKYLSKTIPQILFKKINFIDVSRIKYYKPPIFNADKTVAINIDSMAEMDKSSFKKYLKFININTSYFYSNNTLGKYRPKDVGEHKIRKKDAKEAVMSGPLPKMISIFSFIELTKNLNKYKKAYSPGPLWKVLATAEGPCYPHYRQIIYKKIIRNEKI